MHTRDSARASGAPVPQPPASTTLAGRVLSLLRGDKYMVNAYPPQWRNPTTSVAVAGEASTPTPSALRSLRSAD
jgi:hypothetical protein